MNNKKLTELLKSFDQNQIKEINDFLNSSRGRSIKNKLNNSDKEKLLNEFSKINQNDARRKIKSMKAEDIIRLINKL